MNIACLFGLHKWEYRKIIYDERSSIEIKPIPDWNRRCKRCGLYQRYYGGGILDWWETVEGWAKKKNTRI